jgi:hypothetical protein
MTDHLRKANMELEYSDTLDLEFGYLAALQSIAHSLIAIVERLDRVTESYADTDGGTSHDLRVKAATHKMY